MSAIGTPLTKFSTALTASQSVVVAVEHLNSVQALDIPASITPQKPAQFQIVFTYQYPNGETKDTVIKFSTAAIRNTALTNFHTNFTLTI